MKKSRNYRLVRTACLSSDTLQYRTKKNRSIYFVMTDINSEAKKPDSIENEVRQHILHFEADILI